MLVYTVPKPVTHFSPNFGDEIQRAAFSRYQSKEMKIFNNDNKMTIFSRLKIELATFEVYSCTQKPSVRK